MNQATRLLLTGVLLLITAQRLPAPIQEIPESPTPPPQEQPSKPRHSARPKPAPDKTESTGTTPVPKVVGKPAAAARSRFAGSWAGTMPTVPWGDLPSVVTIDSTETAMAMSWYESDEATGSNICQHFQPSPDTSRGQVSSRPAFAHARREGDTIIATYSAPLLGSSTWSLTPNADGTTAQARMQAFMNDFHAVFHRTTTDAPRVASSTAAPAQPSKSVVPTAKPDPNRPGFVYDPFDPKASRLLDVRGTPSGTRVKDPKTGRIFIVP